MSTTVKISSPLRIAAALLCLVLISAYMVSGLYARYTTSGSGEDSARVAVFGHDESITLAGDMSTMKPGDTRSYNIVVSNYRGSSASEVAQRYGIEVETAGNLPLGFKLEQNGGAAEIAESDASTAATHLYQTSNMYFSAGKALKAEYTLVVTWPKESNSSSLAGLPDFIQVTVRAEQVD